MKISDPAQALQIMKRTMRELADTGAISLRSDAEPAAFFGFQPENVSAVHFLKSGASGVWLRLEDGRVFNRYGGIDDPDTALFDSVEG
jgi:hypothetical protein